MRVLDEADEIPEWIGHGRNANALSDVLRWRLERRAGAYKLFHGVVQFGHAPIGDDAARARFCALGVGIQAELEASDVEAHVKGLIEVRGHTECRAIPAFGALQIGNLIDDSAQAEDHAYSEQRRGTPRRMRTE